MIIWLVLRSQSWENAMLISLMNGYQTKFKLNDVELKLLDRLIVLNLVLKIIELDELNLEKFYFDKLVEIFDNSYKNPNYILNKIK
jgi:Ser/Thr protein kinase RdoA (MazF antagonist)